MSARDIRTVVVARDDAFSAAPLAALCAAGTVAGIIEIPREARWLPGAGLCLREAAAGARVPYMTLGDESTAEFLKEFSAEAVLSFCLGETPPAEDLAAAPFGFVNFQPAPLPERRGPQPWFWQYYAGDAVCAVTAHRVEGTLHGGPVLRARKFPMPLGMAPAELAREAGRAAALMLPGVLEDLAAGAPGEPQRLAGRGLTARDVRPGERLIDWDNWPLDRVWHVLRGAEPWLEALPEVPALAEGGRWEVEGFELEPMRGRSGALRRDWAGWYLTHRRGKIRIRAVGAPAVAATPETRPLETYGLRAAL